MATWSGRGVDPEAKLPVDDTVKVPPNVAAATAAANALHAAAYPPAQPDPVVKDPPLQPDPAREQQPPIPAAPALADPVREQQAAPAAPGPNAEHTPAYFAMKGRYDQANQTIGSMQEQMAELGDELVRTQALIRMNPRERDAAMDPNSGQRAPGAAPRRLVTDEDVKTLGPELIDAMQRIARDAIAPDLGRLGQAVQQTSQRVGQVTQADMITVLDREVPTWKEINTDPRFKNWCRSPDVYSGQVRGKLLNAAFQAANAPRVVAFFKGFLSEEQATGQLPVPGATQQPQVAAPRLAAVSLESLAAPGRPKPAGGDSPAGAADKPVFTRAQIQAFYRTVQQGAYIGRDADKLRDEQAIFAAQREGRVRG